jgi:2-keto-myo-inositol isomerase
LDAIDQAEGGDVFKLVHDTFHHHLAGETEFFPERTGIVHISGVVDPALAVDEMLDPHRVLVDAEDRFANLPQIRTLLSMGFDGPFSFEPFAGKVHDHPHPEVALHESMDYVTTRI